MSLKAVELQIAIPRTQELTRQQESYQQRQMHDQQALLAERNQMDEAIRQRATDVDEASKGLIKEKQERGKRQQQQQKGKPAQTAQEQQELRTSAKIPMRDPLRGRHVDISL